VSTQATLDQIQELYIAYYGRPADTDGLNYWATQLDAQNGNLTNIINAFATSAESVALYGENASPEDLVTAIYQNVLHRTPDAAGLEFYAQALKAGTITAGSLALSVLSGVQNEDVATIQNELSAANQFTASAANYGGDTASAIGRTFLSQVSSDSSANDALLSHLASYTNAASAATSDPSQFDGKISGGKLTDPTVVDQYASGTTPSTGDNGSTGGDTGGSTGGDTGGSTGGDTGGSTGGDTGGSNGGDTGGSTGGDTGGSTGGDTGGSTGGDTGGSTGGDTGGWPGGDTGGTPVTGTVAELTNNLPSGAYIVVDTAANILQASAGAVVTGASSVELLDNASVSVADAQTLAATNNFSVNGHELTLVDTIAILAGHTTVAGATSYVVADTADHILDNLAGALVSGAQAVELTADATETVSAAQSLASTNNFSLNGHSLSLLDTVAHLTGHTAEAGATNYVILDTAENIAAAAASPVVQGAQSVELQGDAVVSVAQANAIAGLLNLDTQGYSLSLADTISNLTNHTSAGGATSYVVVDTADNIVVGAITPVVAGAQSVELSADALVSVAQAHLLASLVPNLGLNGHTLTLADTIENLSGNTTAAGAAAYDVVDTAESIIANAAGAIVSGAHAVELSGDASVSVADAQALASTSNFSVNGHVLTLVDNIQALTDSTTVAGATAYTVVDTAADIAAGAADSVVAGAQAVELSGDASVSVEQAQALATVSNFDVNGHTLTLTDTIENLGGNTTVAGATAYDIVDTAESIVANASGAVVTGAHAVELSADASVSVANAQTLESTSNFSLNGHALSLVDSITNLAGHTVEAGATSYDVVDSADQIVSNATSAVVTGAHSVTLSGDASVSVEDAQTLESTNSFGLGGHTLSLSDTVANLTGHTAIAGVSSYSVVDSASNVQGDLDTDSGVVTGAQSITVTMDQGTLDLTNFSGSSTVVEGNTNETITFGSHGSAIDVLQVSATSGLQDTVQGFASQDIIQSQGALAHAGNELDAVNGMVSQSTYTDVTAFLDAVQTTAASAAGDTVAWTDGHDTYVAVFHGTDAGQAHVVELVGVAATAVSQAGQGVHIA
jgi:hypothetical protein